LTSDNWFNRSRWTRKGFDQMADPRRVTVRAARLVTQSSCCAVGDASQGPLSVKALVGTVLRRLS
jgi:hypothetical protein